jgi:hypothetical protein
MAKINYLYTLVPIVKSQTNMLNQIGPIPLALIINPINLVNFRTVVVKPGLVLVNIVVVKIPRNGEEDLMEQPLHCPTDCKDTRVKQRMLPDYARLIHPTGRMVLC